MLLKSMNFISLKVNHGIGKIKVKSLFYVNLKTYNDLNGSIYPPIQYSYTSTNTNILDYIESSNN